MLKKIIDAIIAFFIGPKSIDPVAPYKIEAPESTGTVTATVVALPTVIGGPAVVEYTAPAVVPEVVVAEKVIAPAKKTVTKPVVKAPAKEAKAKPEAKAKAPAKAAKPVVKTVAKPVAKAPAKVAVAKKPAARTTKK